MSRSAPIIPVDAKMYRHFAIATVLITGCLAMFASGENREALQAQLEAKQQQNAAQQAEQEAAKEKGIGKKGNFTDKRKSKGSFTPDYALRDRPPVEARRNAGKGVALDAELVAGDRVVFKDEKGSYAGPGNTRFAGPPPPGMTPQQYAQIQSQGQAAKKKKPAPRPAMSQQELDAMIAASATRSQTRRD